MLRESPVYRRDAVIAGLKRTGWTIGDKPDLLVIWNRYGRFHEAANQVEHRGGSVIVMENGYFGRDTKGGPWYAIGRDHHQSTPITVGGRERIGRMPAKIQPWRDGGSEIVILAQRGIGEPGIRQPDGWPQHALRRVSEISNRPVRIRHHPGKTESLPLLTDLKNAWCVVTWASGAAIKALAAGIPVVYGYRHWIAGMGGVYIDDWDGSTPRGDREAAMNRCAWGTWSVDEISQGDPWKFLV